METRKEAKAFISTTFAGPKNGPARGRVTPQRALRLEHNFYKRQQQQIPEKPTTTANNLTEKAMTDINEVKILLSINRAADLLEKDRATLVRALRHTRPNGYQGEQPRWMLQTIVDALAVKPSERRETGRYRDRYRLRASKALDALLAEFEELVVQIGDETSPDKRRQMALALAPLLDEFQTTYQGVGRALRVDPDVLGARADLIASEMLDEVAEAAQWGDRGGFFAEMVAAMQVHADDGEAV
ncbi:hypothetical protein [Bradyrhizobium sp. I1.7.5]|uniref:hypothetical protein n=1 Tax=Bradyrhizobium sp. I1.7.5 TaxID=3156363 RepID=UPI003397E217